MKKILILCMSCNDKFFVDQCEVIKQTWASSIIEGKHPNIDFMIYTATDGKQHYDKDNHTLYVRVEDDLDNTYKKTHYALNIIQKNFDYDYIFRTNTSTFVNVDLLEAFVNSLQTDDVCWCSELYSLSEAMVPYPLTAYGRGNGILLSKKLVNIILKEGINFIYMEKTDDVVIGNLLNSYWMKQGENYLDHLKSFRHGWFKCIYTNAQNNNSICQYFNDNTDFEFLKTFITIQIKRYREREIENNNYYELDGVFNCMKDKDIDNTVKLQYEYSKNPNIFIGSILGYIDYNKWVNYDKGKLYTLEIYHKASDDAERYKDKKVLY